MERSIPPVFHLKDDEKSDVVEKLISKSSPRQEFFLMMVLSVLMATIGLLIGNPVIVIGSMLVAPLLSPILSLALGVVISDVPLMGRSLYVIAKSILLALVAAVLVAAFFGGFELSEEILSRARPSLSFASVAVVAGLAAAFSTIRPNLTEMLPGVAISVALIPPLSVAGIGIARADWIIISGSVSLFLINIAGIIFTSMVVFALADFHLKKKEIEKEIKAEDKAIAKEEGKPPPEKK